ncbi:MAG TPA: isoprenylcysteine carboxylmethyltransferase family protein [Terracidiphilus sp.]|nr:isoprenylcysteine carboxylmethyltransferase family protein [Terracidiphilus sp.]
MTFNVTSAIAWAWYALGALWLFGFFFVKPTIRWQSAGSRLFNLAVALLGFVIFGADWFDQGWLAARFVPAVREAQFAGFAFTVTGVIFAAWARLTLGGNWSGRATVKASHELIVKGPYAIVRHPIYTGLLLALAGTGLDMGQWRAIVGFVLIFVALACKMAQEEQLMMQTFPEAYPLYRQNVKALIPGVL